MSLLYLLTLLTQLTNKSRLAFTSDRSWYTFDIWALFFVALRNTIVVQLDLILAAHSYPTRFRHGLKHTGNSNNTKRSVGIVRRLHTVTHDVFVHSPVLLSVVRTSRRKVQAPRVLDDVHRLVDADRDHLLVTSCNTRRNNIVIMTAICYNEWRVP